MIWGHKGHGLIFQGHEGSRHIFGVKRGHENRGKFFEVKKVMKGHDLIFKVIKGHDEKGQSV